MQAERLGVFLKLLAGCNVCSGARCMRVQCNSLLTGHLLRCTPLHRTSARRAWQGSGRTSTTCWWRRTWPAAASTCRTWRPSSTTTCRTASRTTRTASAARAAPARAATPSPSSRSRCAAARLLLQASRCKNLPEDLQPGACVMGPFPCMSALAFTSLSDCLRRHAHSNLYCAMPVCHD